MDPRESEHLRNFESSLKDWKDERFVTRESVRDLSIFSVYLVNLAEADGWQYVGHSFRARSPMCLLVVRGVLDGIQHVVFTSGRTHTACVRIFLRKMSEGLLEWSVDRYAQ